MFFRSSALALALSFGLMAAPPPNDDFADRLVITGFSNVLAGTTAEATVEPGEPHSASRSLWWSWTATNRGRVSFRTLSASIPLELLVSTGATVSAFPPLSQGNPLVVGFEGLPGQTYAIAVLAPVSPVGEFAVAMVQRPRPPNDNFADRLPLLGGQVTVSGTVREATFESGEPTHNQAPTSSQSVWWTWSAPATGRAYVRVTATNFSPYVDVLTGNSLASLQRVTSSPSSSDPHVSFRATAGVTYHIAVDTALYMYPDSNAGDFILDFEFVTNQPPSITLVQPAEELILAPGADVTVLAEATDPEGDIPYVSFFSSGVLFGSKTNPPYAATLTNLGYGRYHLHARATDSQGEPTFSHTAIVRVPPENDLFANRLSLDGFPAAARGFYGGTHEPGEPPHAGTNGFGSAWWSWRAPSTSSVAVAVVGVNRPIIGVYSGSDLTNLTPVASGVAPAGGQSVAVSFLPAIGQVYHFAVDGLGAGKEFELHVLPLADNDSFVSARLLEGERVSDLGHNFFATRETGEPAIDTFSSGKSVWWRWTAPRSVRFTLATAGSSTRSYLAVFTGTSVASLSLISKDSGLRSPGLFSRVGFDAIEGTTYHFTVDTLQSDAGLVRLTLTPAGLPRLAVRSESSGLRITFEHEAGQYTQLLESTDLVTWNSLGNWLNTNGNLSFLIENPAALPQRFFKARRRQ